MGKVACQAALIAVLLNLPGCGTFPSDESEPSPDAGAFTTGDAAATEAPVANVSPGMLTPTTGPLAPGPSLAGPLAVGLPPLLNAPEALGPYFDQLMFDLIDPLGPSAELDPLDLGTESIRNGPTNPITDLEQLCRDRGDPETFCRRLYGR